MHALYDVILVTTLKKDGKVNIAAKGCVCRGGGGILNDQNKYLSYLFLIVLG